MKNKTRNTRIIFLSFLLGLIIIETTGQTIKGRIIDKVSKSPLAYVNVSLPESSPVMGTTTDEEGYFRIDNVPVGRQTLQAAYLGYLPVNLKNLEVTGSKAVILTIEMEESMEQLKEVTIKATRDKAGTINKMAVVSARTFSVEESQRFAGSGNDVSRMAMNYAGVTAANDAVNDIVIRGNSPSGLLWRMEDVDIYNPNHYGEAGATGGPVSMLNNNVLSNSDFMTSAFPAGYGNALSGVFDLKLRNGNYDNHEFMTMVGFNGFELGAEGPISSKTRATYIVNYRYSVMDLLDKMGINLGTGTGIPRYQDYVGKINVPTKKAGTFSLFSMGGLNSIDFIDSKKDTTKETADNFYTAYESDMYNYNGTAVVGGSHTYFINEKNYTKLTLAANYALNSNKMDSLSTVNREKIHYYDSKFERMKYSGSFYLNSKLSARNNFRVGMRAHREDCNLLDSIFVNSLDQFVTLRDFNGSVWSLSPYANWQYKPGDNTTINAGLQGHYTSAAGKMSVEPRLGVRYRISGNQSINFGYGLHSQMAPIHIYAHQVRMDNNLYTRPNTNLDLIKSHHLVVGYDLSLTENFRIKAEAYYQYLFNTLIDNNESFYSSVNTGSFSGYFPDTIVNGGTGKNYGVELTLEKFMNKGTYMLTTVSLFDSRYTGSDNIERKTTFNGGYVINVLAGKEFVLNGNNPNARNRKLIVTDMKFNLAGGQRYIPIDVEKSQLNNSTMYDFDNAYQDKLNDYMKVDLRLAYKVIGKKVTQEFAFDLKNLTNHKNPLNRVYNAGTGAVETTYQLGFMPMMQYKLQF